VALRTVALALDIAEALMPTAARFTPSLLDEATLESLFVGRHHFVDDCVARVRKAAKSSARSAKLFVGPRGAGKTHLLSLVNYRCRHLEEFGNSFQIAWLPEDLWTIDSLASLLKEIVRSIDPELPDADIGLTETPIETLRRAVSLCGPVVVLIENIDQVFEAMGESGQRELRALIENTGSLLLIATSTRSNESLNNQASPFYGFFDTTELEQFSIDDAAMMLKRIADQNGNKELSAFLDTPRARQRLAAISHLAGGQPRVWSLLASGLTVEGLDDLVGVLMERFDDLTPYYQEQMGRLSLNERKTVRALTDLDHSCTVKDLAAETGIDQRSISKTISDLRQKGWVRQRTGPIVDLADGRHSYYDLAEPLARLAFQLKESRGKPIRLIVDFLKLWFDTQSLESARERDQPVSGYLDDALLRDHVDEARELLELLDGLQSIRLRPLRIPKKPMPHLLSLLHQLDDGVLRLATQDGACLLALPLALTTPVEQWLRGGWPIARVRLKLAEAALGLGDPRAWIAKLEGLAVALMGEDQSRAYGLLGILYELNGQPELSVASFENFRSCASWQDAVDLAAACMRLGQISTAMQLTIEEPTKSPGTIDHWIMKRGAIRFVGFASQGYFESAVSELVAGFYFLPNPGMFVADLMRSIYPEVSTLNFWGH
jgi:DNA-binding MarR family transcriptional regulator